MYRSICITLALVLVLAACSAPKQDTVNPPQDPEATPKPVPTEVVWTAARFSEKLDDMTADYVSMMGATDTAALNSLLSVPASSPLGAFEISATSLRAPDQLIKTLTHNHDSAKRLPRGVWNYSEAENNWVKVKDSHDITLNFSVTNEDGSSSAVALVVDWTAKQDTIFVAAPEGLKEVPVKPALRWSYDGVWSGRLDANVTWLHSACGLIDEVQSIDLTGETFSTDIAGRITLNAQYHASDIAARADGSNFKADLSAALNARQGDDHGELEFHATGYAHVLRGAQCYRSDLEDISGEAGLKLSTHLDGISDTLKTKLMFDNVVGGDHPSIDLDGTVTINDDYVASYTGSLNDADGDLIIGEDLIVTFDDGESYTLPELVDEYLSDISIMLP